jgi:hypothetical protein
MWLDALMGAFLRLIALAFGDDLAVIAAAMKVARDNTLPNPPFGDLLVR